MKTKSLIICIITIATIAVSCHNRGGGDSQLWVPEPKITGSSFAETIDSLISDSEGNIKIGETNVLFREELLFKKDNDIEETDFVKAITERYDRMSYQRYVNSVIQILQRYDMDYPIEITFSSEDARKIVLGKDMTLEFDKLQESVANGDFKTFNEVSDKIFSYPYITEEPVNEEVLDSFRDSFDTYYDKSAIVPEFEGYMLARVNDQSDAKTANAEEIKARIAQASDIDTRCILALELSKVEGEGTIDWLGDILESGQYSMFLYEVWLQWKYNFQALFGGYSTWSEIPDLYFEKVRNMVLNTMLRYIQDHPDDLEAKCFAFNIAVESNLDRFEGVFGNASINMIYALAHTLFVPE